MERGGLVSVVEWGNCRLVEDHQRFVHAALERLQQHLGEYFAVGLAQASEQDIHLLLAGHVIRPTCGFRIPAPASRSLRTYLALTFATSPHNRVAPGSVLLPRVPHPGHDDALPV